jgi:outer membrane protein assembly factor BamA
MREALMIRPCVCAIAISVLALQSEAGGFLMRQSKSQGQPVFSDACSQNESERTTNLEEAEKNGYAIGRVGFFGNQNTRDLVLRKRILLEEGEPLTREKIEESLKRLSKLKMIYPLRFANFEIQLDRANKIANLEICVTEKRKQK